MKLADVIAEIRAIKPNQYNDDMLVGWLSELDGQLYDSVLRHRENTPVLTAPYSATQDANKDLLVPFPYDRVYVFWLVAKIDFANQEFDRYANSMMMYNEYLEAFSASYAREHRAISKGWITV